MAMLLLLTLPLVAPALGQTAHQRLLLCCRMGAHHCVTTAISDAPMVHERCPAVSQASVAGHEAGWMAADAYPAEHGTSVEAFKARQVEAGYRISFHRSRQKRGPPAVRLS